jgi:hypothetical protein
MRGAADAIGCRRNSGGAGEAAVPIAPCIVRWGPDSWRHMHTRWCQSVRRTCVVKRHLEARNSFPVKVTQGPTWRLPCHRENASCPWAPLCLGLRQDLSRRRLATAGTFHCAAYLIRTRTRVVRWHPKVDGERRNYSESDFASEWVIAPSAGNKSPHPNVDAPALSYCFHRLRPFMPQTGKECMPVDIRNGATRPGRRTSYELARELQSTKTRELRDALIATGYLRLDAQARALGLPRWPAPGFVDTILS